MFSFYFSDKLLFMVWSLKWEPHVWGDGQEPDFGWQHRRAEEATGRQPLLGFLPLLKHPGCLWESQSPAKQLKKKSLSKAVSVAQSHISSCPLPFNRTRASTEESSSICVDFLKNNFYLEYISHIFLRNDSKESEGTFLGFIERIHSGSTNLSCTRPETKCVLTVLPMSTPRV